MQITPDLINPALVQEFGDEIAPRAHPRQVDLAHSAIDLKANAGRSQILAELEAIFILSQPTVAFDVGEQGREAATLQLADDIVDLGGHVGTGLAFEKHILLITKAQDGPLANPLDQIVVEKVFGAQFQFDLDASLISGPAQTVKSCAQGARLIRIASWKDVRRGNDGACPGIDEQTQHIEGLLDIATAIVDSRNDVSVAIPSPQPNFFGS